MIKNQPDSRFIMVAILLIGLAPPALAVKPQKAQETTAEKEKKTGEESAREDQGEEENFPDLAGVDEDGELMDEFAFLQDSTMVESASRHRQNIGQSPSSVTVITRRDIQASGATTFEDLLRIVPGVGIVTSTVGFSAAVGRLVWSNENIYYLVLIDGREANMELMGYTPWYLQPFFIEDVERIEIIRGPGSSLYGANAIAGVISVTTRAVQEQKLSGWARLSGGEPGRISLGTRASARMGGWGFSLGGGGELMGIYTDPRAAGSRTWKMRAVAEYRWSGSERLTLDLGLSGATSELTSMVGMVKGTQQMRSAQLSYRSEALRGWLVWYQMPSNIDISFPLEYAGIKLATFEPIYVNSHTMDGEMQWTAPRLWEPLLVIVGGGGRAAWLGSQDLLDAESFTDLESPDYHKPGISHWELRAGAFVHTELAPTDWVTLTADARLDYNTVTDFFISPRLAAVFQPLKDQFLRLGAARAFRKPAFVDTGVHPMVSFPPDGPIAGRDREKFLEFMTRVSGNADLDNEELWAFEAGYLGRFLDGRLSVSLDLYCNLLGNEVRFETHIVPGEHGLPDLENSSAMSVNRDRNTIIAGSELCLRFDVSDGLTLQAYWDHRELFGSASGTSPRNLLGIGGRFESASGLVGSLFIFTRSEFTDDGIQNPAGLFAEPLVQKLGNVAIVMGKLGLRWRAGPAAELQAGLKLFLPVSPFTAPHFRFRDEGGGTTASGEAYGGVDLTRMLTAYLEGSF